MGRTLNFVAPMEETVAQMLIGNWEKTIDSFVYEGMNFAYTSDDMHIGVDSATLAKFTEKQIIPFIKTDIRGGYISEEDCHNGGHSRLRIKISILDETLLFHIIKAIIENSKFHREYFLD